MKTVRPKKTRRSGGKVLQERFAEREQRQIKDEIESCFLRNTRKYKIFAHFFRKSSAL